MQTNTDEYLDCGTKGTAKQAKTTLRRCLATGDSRPQASMIRFVLSPEDRVTPDIKGNLPGRGMWVTANRTALQTVIDKRLFNRGAKKQVTVPDNLIQMIIDIYQKRCLSNLSLANRAGEVIMGRDSVKTALQSHKNVACLIQGHDASQKELDKLAVIAKATDIPVLRPLSAEQMGGAFGKEHAVHALLKAGGLANMLMADMGHLYQIQGVLDRA